MILLDKCKYEIEKLRESLHKAIKHEDPEVIIAISTELDELIVEYMQEIMKK